MHRGSIESTHFARGDDARRVASSPALRLEPRRTFNHRADPCISAAPLGSRWVRFRNANRAILTACTKCFPLAATSTRSATSADSTSGTLDPSAAVARIRALPDRSTEVMSQDEEQLRARPEPDTWLRRSSTTQRVINAIASIEWGARLFAAGRSPDWDELSEDSLPGVFEHDTHDCSRFDIADTLDSLGAVARSMATFAESLTPQEQVVVALYAEGWVEINTTAVIRHALHDAEHHLLDVRRGIARQQLRR